MATAARSASMDGSIGLPAPNNVVLSIAVDVVHTVASRLLSAWMRSTSANRPHPPTQCSHACTYVEFRTAGTTARRPLNTDLRARPDAGATPSR